MQTDHDIGGDGVGDSAHYELRNPHQGPFDISYHVVENVTINDDVPDQVESFSCSAEFKIIARLKINEDGEIREFEFGGGKVFRSSKHNTKPYYAYSYVRPYSGKLVEFHDHSSRMTFGKVLGLGVIEFSIAVDQHMTALAIKKYPDAPRSDR